MNRDILSCSNVAKRDVFFLRRVVINYVFFRVFTENSRISAFCFAFC